MGDGPTFSFPSCVPATLNFLIVWMRAGKCATVFPLTAEERRSCLRSSLGLQRTPLPSVVRPQSSCSATLQGFFHIVHLLHVLPLSASFPICFSATVDDIDFLETHPLVFPLAVQRLGDFWPPPNVKATCCNWFCCRWIQIKNKQRTEYALLHLNARAM